MKGKNLCEKEDLVGEWTIMFRSYEENVLNFEIVNSILPNQEYQYEECEVAYELNPVP